MKAQAAESSDYEPRMAALHYSFLQGFGMDFASRIIFIFSGWILNIYLARIFGPEQYGQIGLLLNLLTIYSIFLTNGVKQSVALCVAKGSYSTTDMFFKAGVIQGIVIVLLIVSSTLVFPFLVKILQTPDLLPYYHYVLLILPLNGAYNILIGLVNGQQNFRLQSISTSIYSLVRAVGSVFLIAIFGMKIGGILVGTSLAYLAGGVVALAFCEKVRSGSCVTIMELTKYAISYINIFVWVTLLLNIDIFILKALGLTGKETGIYNAVINIGRVIYFLFYSVISTIHPILVKYVYDERQSEMQSLIYKAYWSFGILSLFTAIILVVLGESIATLLFGKEYAIAGELLPLYCLNILIVVFSVFLSNIIVIVKNAKMIMYVYPALFVSYCIGIYTLYPQYALSAAPFSLSVIALIILILQTAFLKRLKLVGIATFGIVGFFSVILSAVAIRLLS